MQTTLADILKPLGLAVPPEAARAVVCDATHDSRRVTAGSLFFAVGGKHVDGHGFVAAARQAGAVAAIVEHRVDDPLPQVLVPSVLSAMGPISAAVHGHPSRALTVWGVTGSNGKSTSTYLLEAVGGALGKQVGVVGTIEYRWPGNVLPAPNTTPFASDLQSILARMRDDGVEWAALEVSSHALAEGRAAAVVFAGALFTNLSPEHLDYHKTLAAYREAKALLFTEHAHEGTVSALNVDDEAGRDIAGRIRRGKVVRFGLGPGTDVRAEEIVLRADGASFAVRHPGGRFRIESHLLGRHNVYNVLGVAALLLGAGVPDEAVARGVAALTSVPGRLEEVRAGQPFVVTVDYCHTPDGLEQALRTVSELPHHRILTVFGCGGDRDRTKRAPMGAIAEHYSDVPIVTSDNPRTEDPRAIIDEILAGMKKPASERHVLVDRREAIRLAVSLARPGDVVLIAGKGHETYQEFAHGRVDFDDRRVAREALEALSWSA